MAVSQYAESTTGQHVRASLATLATTDTLSIDQLKRGRRALKTLDLGVELARGKKLNNIEREAAARLHSQVHGQSPCRPQIGAASVWALSAPAWAVETMPAPPTPRQQPRRQPRQRTTRSAPKSGTSATRSISPTQRSSLASAPQSPSGSLSLCLSVRKDHQARARAGEQNSTPTTPRPLALQRAAAQLVDRIPALRTIVGIDDATGRRRGHIGTVCDLLVDSGIDTDRWTGVDIAHALNHDGTTRGWTWPTAHAMTSPLRLVAYRLSRLDWTVPSPTEQKTHDRTHKGETPTDAAHRMIKTRHCALVATSLPQARPATGEHRRAVRDQLTLDLAVKRTAAARRAR